MNERQRLRRQGRRRDLPARAQSVLLSDVGLAARLAGAIFGLAASGGVAALALATIVERERAALFVWGIASVAVILGVALGALIVARRRDTSEGWQATLRARVALGLLALGTLAGVLRGSVQPPPLAVCFGLLAAILVAVVGGWSSSFASGAVSRAASARRQGWYAQIRASRLTRRMIGYTAYRQLRRDGALPVKSLVHPNRTYLVPIRTTPSGARILVLDGERPIGGLCLRPRQPLPDPEEALAHILAIRTDERAWLDRANFFPQDRALTPQALGLAPGRPGNYER